MVRSGYTATAHFLKQKNSSCVGLAHMYLTVEIVASLIIHDRYPIEFLLLN